MTVDLNCAAICLAKLCTKNILCMVSTLHRTIRKMYTSSIKKYVELHTIYLMKETLVVQRNLECYIRIKPWKTESIKPSQLDKGVITRAHDPGAGASCVELRINEGR